MYNTAASENRIDFVDFSNLIVDLVKMGYLSVHNFRLIRVLISNNCLNYAHLCLYINKLLDHLCEFDISFSRFQNLLNTCINSYLMSIFERSVERHFEEVMYTAKLASVFDDQFADKSNEYVFFSVYDIISYYSDSECLSIELPVEIVCTEKEKCDLKESLELPLEIVDCKKENCDLKESFEVEEEKYVVNESLEVSLENVDCKKEICEVKENVEVKKEKCHVKESLELPEDFLDWKKNESCDIKETLELPLKPVDCKKLKWDFEESIELPVDNVKENLEKELNIVDEKGFKSFILPLQQDYTKSSEGYRLREAAFQTNTTSCNNSKLEEFDYDGELSENCTSSLSVVFKNRKIEKQEGLGDTCTKSKNDIFLSSNEHTNNTNQMVLKNCDNFPHIKSPAGETAPSENLTKKVNAPPADLSCCDKDGDTDSDDSIIFNATLETVEAENDDSFGQDDDCTDLISDTDDSDDGIIFSEEVVPPSQGQSLTFCLTQFFVSPPDSDSSESSANDDDDDDDWDVDDRSVSVFESHDFEIIDNSRFSLSQEKIYTTLTPVSFEGYANECFEEDDDEDYNIFSNKSSRLKIINDTWNSTMKEFPSEPRESKKVSFLPFPDLVDIRCFEPEDDGYKYSVYVMDQLRFRNRISAFEMLMTPYLTPEHRTNIYQKHFLSEK